MAHKIPPILIGDKLVDISDIKELNEAVDRSHKVKDAQGNFDIVQDQIKVYDKKSAAYGKFTTLLKELDSASIELAGRIGIKAKTSSIFDARQVVASGRLASNIGDYAQLVVENGAECNEVEMVIEAVAKPMIMESSNINMPIKKAVVGAGLQLKSGTFKVNVQNNARKLKYLEDSGQNIVINDGASSPGIKALKAGVFFINDKAVTMIDGMKMSDVVQAIANANAGVVGKIEDGHLVIASAKIGAEYDYILNDPDGVFSLITGGSGGEVLQSAFVEYPQYTEITLKNGDTILQVANTINAADCGIKARASTVNSQVSRLFLHSNLTGVDNVFKIIDGTDALGNDIVLDGTKSGKVFGDIFVLQSGAHIIHGSNARVTIGYDTIERAKNIIDDYLDKVTVHIRNVTPAEQKIQFSIGADNHAIIEKIQKFIQCHNEVIKFVAQQRQTDSNARKLPGSELVNDNVVNRIMHTIHSNVVQLLKKSIGFRFQKIDEDYSYRADDKSDVTKRRIDYSGILVVDQDKLTKALIQDLEGVKKTFSFVANSSNSNFINMNIHNNTKAFLNGSEVDIDKIDLRVDIDAAKVLYSQSSGFLSDSTSVVSADGGSGHLKAGKFYLNGYAVELAIGDSLGTVAAKINSVSNNSKIVATKTEQNISGVIYHFLKLGEENISSALYDPNEIMSDVFSQKIYTQEFSIEEINLRLGLVFLPGIGISSKKIKINGVNIEFSNPPYTIDSFVAAINAHKSATNVIAKYTKVAQGILGLLPSYVMTFEPLNMGEVVIIDQNNVFGGKIIDRVDSGGGEKFYDTSKVMAADVYALSEAYQKAVVFYAKNKQNLSEGGLIKIINLDQSGLVVAADGLRFLYSGSGNDSAEVEITAGVAAKLSAYIGKINESNGLLPNIVHSFHKQTTEFDKKSVALKKKLDAERAKIRGELSQMSVKASQHEQMQDAWQKLFDDF